MSSMKRFLSILAEAFRRFNEDDGWAIASHIALSTLTSLFPFVIFVTAIASLFNTKELADEAARILLDAWPEQVAEPLAREIRNVLTQTRGGLITVGIVLAIYFSTSAVEALRIALTRAYELREQRSWWLLRIESALYVLVGAIGLLALALLLVLAPLLWRAALRLAPALEPLRDVVTLYRFAVAGVLLLIPLVIAHKYLPPGRRRWRDIAPGVAFTFFVWIAAGEAFGYYLAEFAANYVLTYAGLASVMIALLFLYMLGAIFIYGGELNAAFIHARAQELAPPPPPPTPAPEPETKKSPEREAPGPPDQG